MKWNMIKSCHKWAMVRLGKKKMAYIISQDVPLYGITGVP